MEDYSHNSQRGQITETSPGVFKADDTIIKSVSAAREIYFKLRTDHLKRILFYADAEGLLQGNPPFDPAEMAAAGLGHVANFNDMSARAIYERYCQAYWNLLYNAQYITNFVLRIKDSKAPDYAQAMSKNWNTVVKKYWPSFHVNVSTLIAQLVKFGISPVIFPDERSPEWRVVELSNFFVPNQAQSDLDLLGTMCVESEFSVQYLWQIFVEFKDKSEEAKKEIPWNVDQIARLLIQLNPALRDSGDTPLNAFELNRKILAGDVSYDRMFNDAVKIVSLFQKEYNGKISHYMFHRHITAGQENAGARPGSGEDFLFYSHEQYQNWKEASLVFSLTPGEYTIHNNRGLCHKIYSLSQASIMMDCSLIDGGRWAATPIIKSSALNSHDVAQIRFTPGVPTDIGGAEFVQNNLGSNLQHIIGVAQYCKAQMRENLTYSGSDPASPDADKGSLSPTQSKLGAFREFNVMKNGVLHFYNTFDGVVENMVDKMGRSSEGDPQYEMAKEWRELCIDDGVPKEVFELFKANKKKKPYGLPKEIQVTATRVAGAGSQAALLMGLEALNPIIGSFTVDEQQEYKKLYVSAAVGPEFIDTFAQKPKPDESRGGSSLAGVENAIMQGGKSPVFSPDNEHRSHWITHYALLSQTMQGVQSQQLDVIEADKIFSVGIPHISDHFNALIANPFAQDFANQVKPYQTELTKFAALNRRNAEKSMQAQQEQAQKDAEQTEMTMNDEQRKNFVTMNEEHRKDTKLQAQTERQKEAGQAKEQALAKKTEGDLRIEATKVLSGHHIELTQIAAEDARERMKDAMSSSKEGEKKEGGGEKDE